MDEWPLTRAEYAIHGANPDAAPGAEPGDEDVFLFYDRPEATSPNESIQVTVRPPGGRYFEDSLTFAEQRVASGDWVRREMTLAGRPATVYSGALEGGADDRIDSIDVYLPDAFDGHPCVGSGRSANGAGGAVAGGVKAMVTFTFPPPPLRMAALRFVGFRSAALGTRSGVDWEHFSPKGWRWPLTPTNSPNGPGETYLTQMAKGSARSPVSAFPAASTAPGGYWWVTPAAKTCSYRPNRSALRTSGWCCPTPKGTWSSPPAFEQDRPLSKADERRLGLHYGFCGRMPGNECRNGCGLCIAHKRVERLT